MDPTTADLLEILRPDGPIRTLAAAQSESLLALAKRHQVLPQVGKRVREGRLNLDPDCAVRLQDSLKHNTMRALSAAAVLAELQAVLGRESIGFIALKGVALSQVLYGDIGGRYVGDVDVLVDPAQLEAADRALSAAGYKRTFPAAMLSRSQMRLYTTLRHEFVYQDPSYDFRVELHWQLNNCPSLTPGTFAELRSRHDDVRVGEIDVPVLGNDDLVLHLCIHGGTEAWPKLMWLYDLARVLERYEGPSSERLLTHGRRAGLDRLLLLGVALAGELLGAEVPTAFTKAIDREPVVMRLLTYARRNLLELRFRPGGGGALLEAASGPLYRARLSSNWRYRLESLAADVIVPDTVLEARFGHWPYWVLTTAAAIGTLGARIGRRTAGNGWI